MIQDSDGITKEATYRYKLVYSNSNGESSPVYTEEYTHEFVGPTVQVHATSSTSFDLIWESQNPFSLIPTTTHWKIEKEVTITSSDGSIDTYPLETISTESLDYSPDGEYRVNDFDVPEAAETSNEGKLISYYITISQIIDGIPSDPSEPVDKTFNALTFTFIDWIPMNSSKMLVYWEVVPLTISAGYDLYAYNDELGGVSVDISTIDADNLSGYFIDDMDPALIAAGDNVTYNLVWCDKGEENDISECPNTDIETYTFPIYDMHYVPKVVDYDGITQQEPFYIDIYEVYESLDETYNEGLSSAENKSPVSANYNQASAFCQSRTPAVIDNINFDFRLPTENEWRTAARFYNNGSYGYEFSTDPDVFAITFDSNSILEYDYPVEVGLYGIVDCSYANIIGCSVESSPIAVGEFNGIGYNQATSPSNLFDCSGNMMEWVTRENADNDEREMLMGGDYNSSSSEATSNSYMLQYDDYISSGTGFRTAMDASDFLHNWKELH